MVSPKKGKDMEKLKNADNALIGITGISPIDPGLISILFKLTGLKNKKL